MSANNNESFSLQTTSSLTPANSLTKKVIEELKKKKSPFSMQKELFMSQSELLSKYSHGGHSVSPRKKRFNDSKLDLPKCNLVMSSNNKPLITKRKKVTFKGNFIQVINVISYKKYYIEEEKQKGQTQQFSRCNCFIF